jgi:hypothetical protein
LSGADAVSDRLALSIRALITPDERGSDNFIMFVEQDRSMHLP